MHKKSGTNHAIEIEQFKTRAPVASEFVYHVRRFAIYSLQTKVNKNNVFSFIYIINIGKTVNFSL